MHDAPYREVPLFARDGSIRAHALVDEDDHVAWGEYRWARTKRGYVTVFVRGVGRRGRGVKGPGHYVYLHRAVMGCVPRDGLVVDHISGDRLDNRRANLRIVTPGQNRQNVRGYGKYSSHRGVSYDVSRETWVAYGQAPGGTLTMLGRFGSESEAAEVAEAWRLACMPFAVAGR